MICCSDSRVLPESLFCAGIGELFVIRVAGNVIDNHQLGSIEYAAEHVGCPLILVLGHDRCGAVDAAIRHDPDGYIKFITDEIREAIGEERDLLRGGGVERDMSRHPGLEGLVQADHQGGRQDVQTHRVFFFSHGIPLLWDNKTGRPGCRTARSLEAITSCRRLPSAPCQP